MPPLPPWLPSAKPAPVVTSRLFPARFISRGVGRMARHVSRFGACNQERFVSKKSVGATLQEGASFEEEASMIRSAANGGHGHGFQGEATRKVPMMAVSKEGQWIATSAWAIMASIPHKLTRDIAFVLFCPELLLNSNELPIVDHSLFGIGPSCHQNFLFEWLNSLKPEFVEDWFKNRRRSSRLGDHFADCVEFVLRFGPKFRPKQLKVSVQVHLEIPLVTSQVDVLSLSDVTSHIPLVWEPIVSKLQEDTIGTLGQRVGEIGGRELPELVFNEISTLYSVEEFGHSSLKADEAEPLKENKFFDRGKTIRSPMSLTSLKKVTRRDRKRLWKEANGRRKMTTVGEFDLLFRLPVKVPYVEKINDVSYDCCVESTSHREALKSFISKESLEKVHHWELTVKFLLYVGPWELLGLPSPPGNHQKESLVGSEGQIKDLNKGERVSSVQEEKENGVMMGGNCSSDDVLGWFLGPHLGESLLNRKERLRRQLKLADTPLGSNLLKDLYGQRCEIFVGERSEFEEGGGDKIPEDVEEAWESKMEGDGTRAGVCFKAQTSVTSVLKEGEDGEEVEDGDKGDIVGDIVAVGDAWYTGRQDEEEVQFQRNATHSVKDSANDSGNDSSVLVERAALLEGYLFYEYPLWERLKKRGFGLSRKAISEGDVKKNVGDTSFDKFFMEKNGKVLNTKLEAMSRPENSLVNPDHWSGWWTCDLDRLVSLPEKKDKRWYVIPKLEWLSPILVQSGDVEGNKKVLTANEILNVAKKVRLEAKGFQALRSQRFLIAEMQWEENYSSFVGYDEKDDDDRAPERETKRDLEREPIEEGKSGINESCDYKDGEKLGLKGAWVEVSRGFLVEATWPDSKEYRPHGFVPVWSPTLNNL